MTDKNIRRFQMHVQVKDSGVFSKKEDALTKTLIDGMRDKGYIPVLDLGVYRTVNYNEDETFTYTLTVHGVYIGRKKAWVTEGLVGGKIMGVPTPVVKSKQSSPQSE